MTDTSTPAITALLDGVTPGPWGAQTVRTSCGVCHKIGPWPHKWRAGVDMSACIYDDYPSPPEGTDVMLANTRFIAAARDLVPALLAERDALAAELAMMKGGAPLTRHNYTVELLITGTNGKTRIANCTQSGWDMTPGQACRKAVEYVTLYWPNVAEAKALRVHFDGKGWVDQAGASGAQAQAHEAKHG